MEPEQKRMCPRQLTESLRKKNNYYVIVNTTKREQITVFDGRERKYLTHRQKKNERKVCKKNNYYVLNAGRGLWRRKKIYIFIIKIVHVQNSRTTNKHLIITFMTNPQHATNVSWNTGNVSLII